MDVTEVIDSYVHDVARRLPPGKRNDVAFELRALLADDLQDRAEAEGRSPVCSSRSGAGRRRPTTRRSAPTPPSSPGSASWSWCSA
jgi:hypothetical protein